MSHPSARPPRARRRGEWRPPAPWRLGIPALTPAGGRWRTAGTVLAVLLVVFGLTEWPAGWPPPWETDCSFAVAFLAWCQGRILSGMADELAWRDLPHDKP